MNAAPERQFDHIAFLDLFAGSGAVGLEAASRGARRVDLVEADAKAAEVVRRNCVLMPRSCSLHVAKMSVESYLSKPSSHTSFDIVWMDPPYAYPNDAIAHHLEQLAHGFLKPDALIVIERSKRDCAPGWPGWIGDSWAKTYGETAVYFGQKCS